MSGKHKNSFIGIMIAAAGVLIAIAGALIAAGWALMISDGDIDLGFITKHTIPAEELGYRPKINLQFLYENPVAE